MDILEDEKRFASIKAILNDPTLVMERCESISTTVDHMLSPQMTEALCDEGVTCKYNMYSDQTTLRFQKAEPRNHAMLRDGLAIAATLFAAAVIAAISISYQAQNN